MASARPLSQPVFTLMQLEMWNCLARQQMDIGAQRSGKTHELIQELIDLSIRVPGSRTYYTGPNHPVMKPLADDLTNQMSQLGILADHNRQDHIWMSVHQGWIQFKTAEKPESIKGWDCDLVVLDEASLCPELAYINCAIATNVRHGTLRISSNVPEPFHSGYDWITRVFNEWQSDSNAFVRVFPTWSNTAVYPGGRQDPKILELERILPPDIFARRIGADMRVLTGLVYPEFDPMRHVVADAYPGKCCASIDPAYKSIASIHFYDWNGTRLTAFDEVYRSLLTDPDIVSIVANYPIKPEFAVYDSADPGLGAQLEDAGIPAIPSPKGEGSVHKGIMIVKTWFHQNRIHICKRCEKMTWELQRYAFHAKSETPVKVHDHACDELRDLVMVLDASEQRQSEQEIHIQVPMPRIELGQEPGHVWD